jgi:hypothetical protein
MTEPEIIAAASWMDRRANALTYGEVVIRIVRHSGKTVRIEKSVIEKTSVDPGFNTKLINELPSVAKHYTFVYVTA